jgi:uncharacterized protein YaaR (DUF327 family)
MKVINPSNFNTTHSEAKLAPLLNNSAVKKTKEKEKISSNKNKKEIKTFDELIEELIPEKKEPELNRLWKELPDVEKQLIENPTEEHLEKYKQIVKNIAKILVKRNMKIESIKRRTSSGKEVILSYVKVIDDKLHKMMLAIQSKKNTAFEILRNLKEIRGLLLDLKQ